MCIVTIAVCVYHVYRQSESNACKATLLVVMAASSISSRIPSKFQTMNYSYYFLVIYNLVNFVIEHYYLYYLLFMARALNVGE